MDDARKRAIAHKVAPIVDLGLHAAFHIEINGAENYTRSRSTLVIMNHRRDSDGPIIAGALLSRQGLKATGVLPHIVAREDLYHKDFLKEYLETWPDALRQLLTYINVRPLVSLFQACPMRRIPERTLREVLRDLLDLFGDQPLKEVLKPAWLVRFENLTPLHERKALSIRKALQRRYQPLLKQYYGLRKLNRSSFNAVLPYERRAIAAQLQCFVELLERGETVLLTPEGKVSNDGSFGRIRDALHILINRSNVDLRILPTGITYDFMTSGRQRVFLNFGEELTDLQGLPRQAINTAATRAILAQQTVTASQLASRILLSYHTQGSRFIADELTERVGIEAKRCAASGAYVDPRLLVKRDLQKRIQQYLQYALRKRMLVKTTAGAYALDHGLEQPFVHWSVGIMDYIGNELASHTHPWPGVANTAKA
jgi:1-acyl-sn-glycerol-3-phosphate acyltransferase